MLSKFQTASFVNLETYVFGAYPSGLDKLDWNFVFNSDELTTAMISFLVSEPNTSKYVEWTALCRNSNLTAALMVKFISERKPLDYNALAENSNMTIEVVDELRKHKDLFLQHGLKLADAMDKRSTSAERSSVPLDSAKSKPIEDVVITKPGTPIALAAAKSNPIQFVVYNTPDTPIAPAVVTVKPIENAIVAKPGTLIPPLCDVNLVPKLSTASETVATPETSDPRILEYRRKFEKSAMIELYVKYGSSTCVCEPSTATLFAQGGTVIGLPNEGSIQQQTRIEFYTENKSNPFRTSIGSIYRWVEQIARIICQSDDVENFKTAWSALSIAPKYVNIGLFSSSIIEKSYILQTAVSLPLLAAHYNRAKILDVLLNEYEQDPTHLGGYNGDISALNVAVRGGHVDCFYALVRKCPSMVDSKKFERAFFVSSCNVPIISTLLLVGAKLDDHKYWRDCLYVIRKNIEIYDSAKIVELIKMAKLEAYALRYAASTCNSQRVELLLDHGADVREIIDGESILDYVSKISPSEDNSKKREMVKIIQLLVDYGADMNSLHGVERPPLHNFATHGFVDAIEFILRQDIIFRNTRNARDAKNGQTAMHIACAAGRLDVAKLLYRSGWSVYIADDNGVRPIDLAQQWSEIVTFLKSCGAVHRPNVPWYPKMCEFFLDIQNGNIELIKSHLLNGAHAELTNHHGETALRCAMRYKQFEIVKLLIPYMSNPHEALYCAIFQMTGLDIIKMILDSGADVNTQYNGKPMIHWVHPRDERYQQVVALLKQYGANDNPEKRPTYPRKVATKPAVDSVPLDSAKSKPIEDVVINKPGTPIVPAAGESKPTKYVLHNTPNAQIEPTVVNLTPIAPAAGESKSIKYVLHNTPNAQIEPATETLEPVATKPAVDSVPETVVSKDESEPTVAAVVIDIPIVGANLKPSKVDAIAESIESKTKTDEARAAVIRKNIDFFSIPTLKSHSVWNYMESHEPDQLDMDIICTHKAMTADIIERMVLDSRYNFDWELLIMNPNLTNEQIYRFIKAGYPVPIDFVKRVRANISHAAVDIFYYKYQYEA